MDWRRGLVLATLVMLIWPIASTHAQRPSSGWVLLKRERISAGATSISFDLRENTERTTAIRVYTEPPARQLKTVRVSYANGQRHFEVRDPSIPILVQFEAIDNRSEFKIVDQVDVEFEGGPGANAGAQVEVWGRVAQAAERTVSPPAEKRSIAAGRPEDRWIAVPVFYGTTRGREQDRQKDAASLASFGSRFDQKLTLGRAVVTVPIEREPGTIPRPPGIVFEFRKEDPTRDFTLARVDVLQPAELKAALSAQATNARRYKGQALVFVHGYNVSFDDGLFRTAQIVHDIGFDGPAVLYSWPSRANLLSYVYDLDAAKLGRDGLHELLETVAANSAVTKVNVIAHSLGNDPLLDVLRAEAQGNDRERARLKFNEIVFASPDVSIPYFTQAAGALLGLARQGITLYASNNDRALLLSAKFRSGVNRAGDVLVSGPVVVPGVESIDVSAADTSWFGINHSAFADRRHIIEDLRLLFEKGVHPPPSRFPIYVQRGPSVQPWWQYLKN